MLGMPWKAAVHGWALVLVGIRHSRVAMSHCPHAAISDQLNLTDFSLLKPRMTPEDYGESDEDYY